MSFYSSPFLLTEKNMLNSFIGKHSSQLFLVGIDFKLILKPIPVVTSVY